MKKSVLTLAVAGVILAAQSASAAVVYDKDGTEMTIGGRVQAVFYNGNTGLMENKDHTISDNVRLNVGGRTKLYDGIYGFGFWEHQWSHDGNSAESTSTKTRDAYVGVDFEKFGLIKAGRYSGAVYYVTELTDLFEDYGFAGTVLDDQRNSGKITYSWNGYGIDVNLECQTAVNNYILPGYIEDEINIKGGFAASLGYTSPDVLFGPISIRAGYEYLKGQSKEEISASALNNVKSWAVGLSWGGEEGPILAGQFNLRDFKFRHGTIDDDGNLVPDYKAIGFEIVAGYNFACGVSIVAGYESLKYDFKDNEDHGLSYRDYTSRKVPVYVNYEVNPNFNVWTEAQFDANSSNIKDADNERLVSDKALFALGARYSF